jgi:hypothetical protein
VQQPIELSNATLAMSIVAFVAAAAVAGSTILYFILLFYFFSEVRRLLISKPIRPVENTEHTHAPMSIAIIGGGPLGRGPNF